MIVDRSGRLVGVEFLRIKPGSSARWHARFYTLGTKMLLGMLGVLGVRAETFRGDLGKIETCRALVAGAVAAFGRLDALCNVAGVLVFTHTQEMTSADRERTLAVNLSAPFYLIQASLPHLLESHGAVVNVTSQAAFVAQAYSTAYSASKEALTHLTRALAMEYMHHPIRINAVAPGGMATNMAATAVFPEGADFGLIKRYSGMRGVVAAPRSRPCAGAVAGRSSTSRPSTA
jgi:NAD(P)-dependent dehydrogenase (short-subunit alcohol dehydrogenase family)